MDHDKALFVPDGDGYVATLRTQGAWHPNHQHGGPVQGLMTRAVEHTPTLVPMQITRLTHDLFRPVPIGPRLTVTTEIVRQGKKIQMVDATLWVGDVEHVRTRGLRLRIEDVSDVPGFPDTDRGPVDIPSADDLPSTDYAGVPNKPGFLDGMELRSFPSTDLAEAAIGRWVGLRGPLVAGEETSPLQLMSVAADFTNLAGVAFDPRGGGTAINPDINVHVLRQPVGEWVAVVGDTRLATHTGVGVSTAELHDRDGLCAVSTTCQLIGRR